MTPDRNLLRLRDIDESLRVVTRHLERGPLEDPLVYDAVRIRLIEIGEAVKDLTPEITESRPGIPWRSIARTRDHLVHRYFETSTEIVRAVVTDGLPPLREAIDDLLVQFSTPGADRMDTREDDPPSGGV